jgi:hypothetical protein
MAKRSNPSGGGDTLILLGVLGVAGYFAYEFFFAPATAAAGTTTTTTPTTTTTTTTTTPPPSASSANPTSQLDTLYTTLIANISAANDSNFTGTGASLTGSAYHFNFYLAIIYSGTIPDPSVVFGSEAAASAPMTATAYWALMAPALKAANPGLSGFGFHGLGVYGGLGYLARGGRW